MRLTESSASISRTELILTQNNSGNAFGPVLVFDRKSSSPNDDDRGGKLSFKFENDANESIEWSYIRYIFTDVSDGSEDGRFEFVSKVNGTNSNALFLTGNLATFGGDILIADGGNIGSASDTDSISIASDGKVTFSQELIAPSLDISGNVDVDGTLEADAITVDGTALATVIAGTTVTNATNATLASTVTVSDSTANTNFPVVFHDESNALLDDTGALRYNPSTGELLVPNLTVAGTTTTVNTVTMNAQNAIVFEGATADANETTLTITDPTADRTISLPDADGTVMVRDSSGVVSGGSTNGEMELQGTNPRIRLTDTSANASAFQIFCTGIGDDTYTITVDNSNTTANSSLLIKVDNEDVASFDTTGILLSTGNTLRFEGSTADANETTLTVVDPTADRTINLPNQSGTIPVLAAVSTTQITSTPEELNVLDGITSTTAELNILDGMTAATSELNVLDGVTATTTELNYLDITTLGTVEASKAVTADANGDVKFINDVIIDNSLTTSNGSDSTTNIMKVQHVASGTHEIHVDPNNQSNYSTLRLSVDGTPYIDMSSTSDLIFIQKPIAFKNTVNGITWEGSTNDTNETLLTVTDPTADRTITLPDATGTVSLVDATETLTNKTFGSDVTFTGSNYNLAWDQSANYLRFNDNARASFGTSDDLNIFHNGTASGITNQTGAINIQNFADNADVAIDTDNGSGGITTYFRADGSTGEAILYFYGTQKVSTRSDGVLVENSIRLSSGSQANVIFTNTAGQLAFGMDGDTTKVVLLLDDEDGQPIFTFSEEDGTAILDGGDTDVTVHKPLIVESGVFSLKNTGTQSEVRLYCESSNAHYAAIKAPAHADFSGNVTLTLPATTGTLISTANSDTPTTTTSSSDADFVLVDDGGTMKKITPANLGIGGGISGITVQDEGSALSTAGTTLNFVGAGVVASGTGATKTITISGGGSGITVQDEGSSLSTVGTTLNFVGAGVTASGTGSTKTITISGSGGGSGITTGKAIAMAMVFG